MLRNVLGQLIQGSVARGQQRELRFCVLYTTRAAPGFHMEQSYEGVQGFSLGQTPLDSVPLVCHWYSSRGVKTLGLRVCFTFPPVTQGYGMISTEPFVEWVHQKRQLK